MCLWVMPLLPCIPNIEKIDDIVDDILVTCEQLHSLIYNTISGPDLIRYNVGTTMTR